MRWPVLRGTCRESFIVGIPCYTNARLEGFNGLFQAARARARGYRNVENFITMGLPDCGPDSGRGGFMNSTSNAEEPKYSRLLLFRSSDMLDRAAHKVKVADDGHAGVPFAESFLVQSEIVNRPGLPV